MKYLFWRGKSLYCRYPIPGKPAHYPLKIKTTGSRTDVNRCIAEGERVLASLRTKAVEDGAFFEIKKPDEAPYNPKYWRIVGRYWYNHLRFQKCGLNERYHLMHSLKAFGRRYAKEIYREDIERWRHEMKSDGAQVNTINNRFAYLCRAYSYANSESNLKFRMSYDPTIGMKKMSGAKVRQFLLTPEQFEKNYRVLKDGWQWREGKPNKHMTQYQIAPAPRFALFYLALWETGRRPVEVSQYAWDMLTELEVAGSLCRVFMVPGDIVKTDEAQAVPISHRLWREISQLGYRQGYVFRNEGGKRWQYWDRHIRKLNSLFGDKAGWARDTRRGFVTRKCEAEGCDPEHVRQCTGHKTDSVFRRYRIGDLRNLIAVVNSQKPVAKHTIFDQIAKQA
ncbi:MAG: hypothetical protein KKH61_20705 [Gammaproteobacteria bacterium]|nr:hypothetical protein [Gammaproteobacteria bacterium]